MIDTNLTRETINKCFDKAEKLYNMDELEIASEVLSFYTGYRVATVIRGGVEKYNQMHEMIMDMSLVISDDIIKAMKEQAKKDGVELG